MKVEEINVQNVLQDIEGLRKEGTGCLYYTMDTNDKENRWAITFGFMPDFTNNENDDDYWLVCGKIAYQPRNSIMQCDFDVDWLLPWNEANNEVETEDVEITSKDDVELLLNEWKRIKKKRNL